MSTQNAVSHASPAFPRSPARMSARPILRRCQTCHAATETPTGKPLTPLIAAAPDMPKPCVKAWDQFEQMEKDVPR